MRHVTQKALVAGQSVNYFRMSERCCNHRAPIDMAKVARRHAHRVLTKVLTSMPASALAAATADRMNETIIPVVSDLCH